MSQHDHTCTLDANDVHDKCKCRCGAWAFSSDEPDWIEPQPTPEPDPRSTPWRRYAND